MYRSGHSYLNLKIVIKIIVNYESFFPNKKSYKKPFSLASDLPLATCSLDTFFLCAFHFSCQLLSPSILPFISLSVPRLPQAVALEACGGHKVAHYTDTDFVQKKKKSINSIQRIRK